MRKCIRYVQTRTGQRNDTKSYPERDKVQLCTGRQLVHQKDIIRFIHSRYVKYHWLGMIKVGENGKTKHQTRYGELSAPALVKLGKKLKLQKYSRKLKCNYILYDAVFGGIPVRIFLVRRSQHGKWNGQLTTDRDLDFSNAWRIFSRRWAIEVVFKDCKTNLGFGKCQSTSFASQIAAATLCCIQYNIRSVARRFSDYETMVASTGMSAKKLCSFPSHNRYGAYSRNWSRQ